jgi:hypothetical protein
MHPPGVEGDDGSHSNTQPSSRVDHAVASASASVPSSSSSSTAVTAPARGAHCRRFLVGALAIVAAARFIGGPRARVRPFGVGERLFGNATQPPLMLWPVEALLAPPAPAGNAGSASAATVLPLSEPVPGWNGADSLRVSGGLSLNRNQGGSVALTVSGSNHFNPSTSTSGSGSGSMLHLPDPLPTLVADSDGAASYAVHALLAHFVKPAWLALVFDMRHQTSQPQPPQMASAFQSHRSGGAEFSKTSILEYLYCPPASKRGSDRSASALSSSSASAAAVSYFSIVSPSSHLRSGSSSSSSSSSLPSTYSTTTAGAAATAASAPDDDDEALLSRVRRAVLRLAAHARAAQARRGQRCRKGNPAHHHAISFAKTSTKFLSNIRDSFSSFEAKKCLNHPIFRPCFYSL